MVSKIENLQAIPIFSSLSQAHLEELSEIAHEKTYRKNQVIFDQGDPGNSLIIILDGLIKISLVDSNNHEFIIKTFGENDFFGEMALLDGGPRSATATAVEDTRALIIFRDNFIGLIQKTPSVALGMLTELSNRLRNTTENISNLTFFDAYGKVARCLLDLAEKIGKNEGDGMSMELTLSRQELANMAGLSRETFARILKEFQVRGCLKVQGKKMTIVDEKVMRREIVL
ncbi:MAG: Crp/Fnr family transcriptional regulator [Nitrospinaceae bacterium]|nr:MAG: Crp/Fnr family transcriptional regulator [Nitrospinaceae bacterium]